MTAYIVRRILLNIPVLFGVSIAVFLLIRLLPGDAIIAMISETGNLTEEQLTAIRAKLGLDKPVYIDYPLWVANMLRGDFGDSLRSGVPVSGRLLDSLPVSMELGILAVAFSVIIGVPSGIISAIYRNSPTDYVARLIAIFGLSVPNFWLGTLVLVMPAIWWGYLPPIIYIPFLDNPGGNLRIMLVPSLVLAFSSAAITSRMSRSMMLEVLREDYIRTARAKGITERVVVTRHALKNAVIPMVEIIGRQMGILFSGTVIIESIFSLPGVGRLTLSAIQQRDYPQIQANAMFFAVVLVSINLILDLTYAWLDPRIRY